MTDQALNLLIQIPLAGVVVVVVYMFLTHLKQAEMRQDAAQERMIKFLAEQEERSREFMQEQNAIHAAAIGRIAEEVKTMRDEQARMNGTLVAHDARSMERKVSR